ncbi:LicD family protein [Romboutsia lituseburensis]|uniref:Lipopolysaccharide cholinephosphotransferase n=1 Tax=Romboutsia lituseburensis DSM 797 TaxID=1121325 RepID=A0A1G9QLT3_9FIRM|nr:LicD family protein [Romboutsia lituseburensis]CEH35580.1 LPS biosynthesis protein [Romboutsia lituseburensis]SDM11982.1 lipopolysaccharide cholinephosphotransferase [Romboutsia lituseburensis DSM 797]
MKVDKELQRKIQLKILEILLEIDRICIKHDIKYYLAYGTTIGAIRHKGFIPWDDDADIHMFKDDYEKFKKICEKELGKEYFLQDEETDKEYKMFLPKVRMNNTAFVQDCTEKWNIHHGIYVDIFILDDCPNNKSLQKMNIKIRKYTECTKRGIYNKENTKNFIKKAIMPLAQNQVFLKFWENCIYNNCSKDTNFCIDINDFGNLFPRDVFGTPRRVEFEGHMLYVPEKAEEYLTYYYGDFMTPPPPEKRVSHHDITFIDLENEYKKVNR